MKKLTPVMFVDEIEPCLGFWTKLGFKRTVEVPEGDQLGFAILAKDTVEVMYQSRASVKKDVPALAGIPSCSALYIEVDDLNAVERSVADAPIVIRRRKTFYGAEEIGVREPAGNIIMFSMQQGA